MRYGNGNEVLGAFPVPPALPTPLPTVTSANAQGRFADLISDCTNSNKNYTKTIGEDLGIKTAETPFNPADGQPLLEPGYSTGGRPELKWKKGKFEGIEVWIDRNDGKGWVYLDKDMRPTLPIKLPRCPHQVPVPSGNTALFTFIKANRQGNGAKPLV